MEHRARNGGRCVDAFLQGEAADVLARHDDGERPDRRKGAHEVAKIRVVCARVPPLPRPEHGERVIRVGGNGVPFPDPKRIFRGAVSEHFVEPRSEELRRVGPGRVQTRECVPSSIGWMHVAADFECRFRGPCRPETFQERVIQGPAAGVSADDQEPVDEIREQDGPVQSLHRPSSPPGGQRDPSDAEVFAEQGVLADDMVERGHAGKARTSSRPGYTAGR